MRNVLVVAGSAVVTALAVLATFWPGTLTADGPDAPAKPLVADPQVQVSGCTIKAAGRWEGSTAVFEITATNPSPKATELALVCMLTNDGGPVNKLSRIGPIAAVLDRQSLSMTLTAGETKTCRIEHVAAVLRPGSKLILRVAPEPQQPGTQVPLLLAFTAPELARLQTPGQAAAASQMTAVPKLQQTIARSRATQKL